MAEKRTQAKRKASPLAIPQPGEDAAERKRVLNVLAQRRYRQRRKQHVQHLEEQAATTRQPQGSPRSASPRRPEPADSIQPTLDMSTVLEQTGFDNNRGFATHTVRGSPSVDLFASYESDPFAVATDPKCFWDTSVLLPSLPNTPLSMSKSSSSNESETWSLPSLPALISPGRRPQSTPSPRSPPGVAGGPYSFPDEANLGMLELDLLRGCMMIARRMNVQETIWSLGATSPFIDPSLGLAEYDCLPENLQPTLLQMTVPHHPVIDLLPWPSARDNLLMVLQQPLEFRPPGAASPMALLDFVYDLEDVAEGVRISGSDPTREENWEIGEKVFKSWWWMFNKDIIRRSNELRASRGAAMLGAGSVLGEVS